jgi:LacI family transcriptional regulator
MSCAHKVAIVSRGSSAYFNRLVLGALSFADMESSIVTRDFRFDNDFHQVSDLEQVLVWKQLRQWNPDGLLCFLDAEPVGILRQSLPQPWPMVNMCVAPRMPGLTVVASSLEANVELGVRHLREQGLRSIAYLEMEEVPFLKERFDLFKRIARPANPAQACFHEVIKFSQLEDPYAPVSPVSSRLAAWLRSLPKPTGVFCPTNGGGGYLIRVCSKLRLRVPEAVAVVGMDDADLANASNPTLTTVLPAAQQIGHAAMQLLDQMINGKPAPTRPVALDAMDLRVRESTGLKRGEICDLAAALEYINQHGSQGISVEQLIKETQQVSTSTFFKAFQAATGQTPGQAIQRRQLEEAQRLLSHTQISLTTIADCCGYCNSSAFARSFRALTGMTPRDYRKKARAKNARA